MRSCALPREPIDRAKKLIEQHTGIPPGNVLIAATHTHSAPPAAHLFQSVPIRSMSTGWWFASPMASRRAVNHLQPARIGWGSGREESLVFNRRYRMKPGTAGTDPFGRSSDTVKMNPGVGNPDVIGPAGPVDP